MKKFTEKAIAATMATVMLLSTASITASAEWIKDNGPKAEDPTWYYASAAGSMQADGTKPNVFLGLVYKFGALKSVNNYISQITGTVLGRTDTWQDTGKQTYYTSAAGDTLLVSDALGDKAATISGDNSVAIGGGNVGGDIIASVDENKNDIADSGLETSDGGEYLARLREQLKYGTAYANYSNSMLSDNKTIQVNITNDKVKVSDAVKNLDFLYNFFHLMNVRKVVVKNGKDGIKDETISGLVFIASASGIQEEFLSIPPAIVKAAGIDLDKNPNATLAELCGHSVDVRVHGTKFVKNLTFRFVNVTPPPTIPPVDETVNDKRD